MENTQNNYQSYAEYGEDTFLTSWGGENYGTDFSEDYTKNWTDSDGENDDWDDNLIEEWKINQEFESENYNDDEEFDNIQQEPTEEADSDDNGDVQAEEDNKSPDQIDDNAEDTTLYSSSNAGTPIENLNIPADVNDGNDIEKLDFSSQYANPNGGGNDQLSGTAGANTFEINPLLNAKPEIYQKHVDGDGKINWQAVAGENDNYHDHWVDSIGQDTILDFSGSSGEGDKINIVGHTVAVTVLEELDSQVKLGLYSDQGADGSRGNGAHDFDVLGTLTINHDGNFDYGNDVSVNPNVFDGAFEFA